LTLPLDLDMGSKLRHRVYVHASTRGIEYVGTLQYY
jgi:hypothetical protein